VKRSLKIFPTKSCRDTLMMLSGPADFRVGVSLLALVNGDR
jgi:hypothetical protein